MADVGIVIPVFGRLDRLTNCLRVLPQGVPVYVIDDCTPDPAEREAIRKLVQSYGFRYFKNATNQGFPRTVNKVVNKVSEPLVLILNSDVVLKGGAIEILVDEFKDPKVGVAAPMLLFPGGTEYGVAGRVQHVGMVFDVVANPEHLFIGWSPLNSRVAVRRDNLQAVTGACLMTRTELFRTKLRGFNEEYGKGTYEDVEYCILVRAMGYKIVCNPEAVGWHYVGQSAKNSGGFALQANFQTFVRNVGRFLRNDDYLFL